MSSSPKHSTNSTTSISKRSPNPDAKKQKIGTEIPIQHINFLSNEDLRHHVRHYYPHLSDDQVIMLSYEDLAKMVAEKYGPTSLMVPYITISTMHNVKVKNVRPDRDFVSTDKATQYLVTLLKNIRRIQHHKTNEQSAMYNFNESSSEVCRNMPKWEVYLRNSLEGKLSPSKIESWIKEAQAVEHGEAEFGDSTFFHFVLDGSKRQDAAKTEHDLVMYTLGESFHKGWIPKCSNNDRTLATMFAEGRLRKPSDEDIRRANEYHKK